MCAERLGIYNLNVSLVELAIPALLRTLPPPDLLDLVAPERKGKLMSVLEHVAGERQSQVEMQTKISWLVRISVQPLHRVHLFVDLTLLGEAIQRLDCPGLYGREAVEFKGLTQPVEYKLFDYPGFRCVLREARQRLGATHALLLGQFCEVLQVRVADSLAGHGRLRA